ncbi:MAG: hypothetical protein GDA67_12120 [Nitrospira sp. CR1.3]|nr:hypothetical protein [Nitrospira sp. CR1.3]
MPDQPRGLQLCNNVTELTAIAPLEPGGADALRAIFQDRKNKELGGERSPIEQIESIHYARWVLIDGGTRLLFTSNFDGNLDDYLAEFAERDEGPLNMIFRYCVGWPGARPVGPFIQYVRDRMVPAEYYYSAYPKYTVNEVKRAIYWKRETEEFINGLVPRFGDVGLDDVTNQIQAFLRRLAMPTPDI